jgi:hypothetical protein
MYYLPDQTSMVWYGSFYEPTPASAPPGHSSISWIGNGITTTIINILGVSFEANKCELLPLPQASLDANPNLTQDYGH